MLSMLYIKSFNPNSLYCMYCCYQFREEAMVPCLLQGHVTSMWWTCDINQIYLTLNPRLLTTTSLQRCVVQCITLLLIFKTPFHCTHFTVIKRMYSRDHSTHGLSLYEVCLVPHTVLSGSARDEHLLPLRDLQSKTCLKAR